MALNQTALLQLVLASRSDTVSPLRNEILLASQTGPVALLGTQRLYEKIDETVKEKDDAIRKKDAAIAEKDTELTGMRERQEALVRETIGILKEGDEKKLMASLSLPPGTSQDTRKAILNSWLRVGVPAPPEATASAAPAPAAGSTSTGTSTP